MSANLRLIASRVIDEVTNGRSLTECLEKSLSTLKDSRDRAFVQAVCYGVCRFYTRLDVILSYLLQKPMKAKDSDVHALLLTGLYQLTDMRVPPHAAVAETVNAAPDPKKPFT
jgi:16S rRNA (cytosine967-C5)-methyltransferase